MMFLYQLFSLPLSLQYNLLSLYNVTCIHVFTAKHLVLDDLLVCVWLWKSIYLIATHTFVPWSSLFRIEALWSFSNLLWHVYFHCPGSAHVWAVMAVPSDITRKHDLMATSLLLYIPQPLHPFFLTVS